MANTTDELDAQRRKRGAKPGRKRGSALGPITGPKEIEARQRQAQALELRKGGATLQQVADAVGYGDASHAHRAVMAALATVLPDSTRDEARRLELARLDGLILAHWPAARGSEVDFDKHARIVLQAIGMRSKLLGLDAPTAVDVRIREGELVHVEILDLLSKEALDGLRPFQDEMVRLSELKSGAIDVTPDTV